MNCVARWNRYAHRALLPRLVIILADWALGHDNVRSINLAADYSSCLLLNVPSILSVGLLSF